MLKLSHAHSLVLIVYKKEINLKYIAVFFINLYQKYVSPYKGFRCAYASIYGGDSCSQAVKKILLDEGVVKGFYSSQSRFRNCRNANEERRKRRREDACDCLSEGFCQATEGCDLPSCDIPCDCSF